MPLTSFQPRYFEQILVDMVQLVRLFAPELTDFNIGSRIRTILESAALEDDEQYHQMTALLQLWNLRNVRGVDLDERLAEYNVSRQRAEKAIGSVIFSNNNLISSFATQSLSIGATSAFLQSTAGFPTTGYPFVVRLSEGTPQEEIVNVSLNNTSQARLFFAAPLVNQHNKGARVSLVLGGALVIPSGTRVRVPATSGYPERTFTTTTAVSISAGNYDSLPAAITADVEGKSGVVAANSILDFVGNPPFNGALVRNESRTTRGLDSESDEAFLSRAVLRPQSLGRATIVSLEQLVLGVEAQNNAGVTFRVLSAKVRERFTPDCNDYVWLYVWAGAFDFVEVVEVNTPEQLTLNAEDGQRFFRLANIAVVPSTLVLQREEVGSGVYVTQTQGIDYFFNEGTGWIEIAGAGLNKGDKLRALRYNHYTGLLLEAQKVINGDPADPLNYQGIRASGVKVLATFPVPRTIPDIRLAIQVRDGFTELQLAPLVRDVIFGYLFELKTGEDIILAEMIERVMRVDGVYNVQFSSPTNDIALLEDEALDLDGLQVLVG